LILFGMSMHVPEAWMADAGTGAASKKIKTVVSV